MVLTMPVKMEPFLLNKKAQAYMFERVQNTRLQLYLFQALQLKKREDKPYKYKSAQRFFSEYTLRVFLQHSQKQTNLKIHSLTKTFTLNIFAMYFRLKLIFFTVHISLF